MVSGDSVNGTQVLEKALGDAEEALAMSTSNVTEASLKVSKCERALEEAQERHAVLEGLCMEIGECSPFLAAMGRRVSCKSWLHHKWRNWAKTAEWGAGLTRKLSCLVCASGQSQPLIRAEERAGWEEGR